MSKIFIFSPYILLIFFLFNDSIFLNLFLNFDITLLNVSFIEKHLDLLFNFCLLCLKTLFSIFYYILLYVYNFIIFLIFCFLEFYFSFLYYLLFGKVFLISIFAVLKFYIVLIFFNFFLYMLFPFFSNLFYLILYIYIAFNIYVYENGIIMSFYYLDSSEPYLVNLTFSYMKEDLYVYFYFCLLHKYFMVLIFHKFFFFNFYSFFFFKFIYNAPLIHIFLTFYIFILNLFLKIQLFLVYVKYIIFFKKFLFFILDVIFFSINFLYLNFNFICYYVIKVILYILMKIFVLFLFFCLKIIPTSLQILFIYILFTVKTLFFDFFFFINNFLKFIVFIIIQILRFGFDFILHDFYITNIPTGNKDYLDNDFHIDYNLFKRLEIVGFSYKPYFKAFYIRPANKLIVNDCSVINNLLYLDKSEYDIAIDFKKLQKYPYFKQTMTPNDLKNFFNYFHLSQNNTIHLHYLLNTDYYIAKDPIAFKDPLVWLENSFHDFLIQRNYIPKFKYMYFNFSEVFYNLNNVSWGYLLTTLKSSYISFVLLKINLNLLFLAFLFIGMFVSWFYFYEWMEYRLIEKDHFNFLNYIIENILIIKNKPLKKILMKNSLLLEFFLYFHTKTNFLFKNFVLYKIIFFIIIFISIFIAFMV